MSAANANATETVNNVAAAEKEVKNESQADEKKDEGFRVSSTFSYID